MILQPHSEGHNPSPEETPAREPFILTPESLSQLIQDIEIALLNYNKRISEEPLASHHASLLAWTIQRLSARRQQLLQLTPQAEIELGIRNARRRIGNVTAVDFHRKARSDGLLEGPALLNALDNIRTETNQAITSWNTFWRH